MITAEKENAIHAWVVATSGLSAERVLWAEQACPLPADGRYVSLRFLDVRQRGQAGATVRDAASPAPGAEIEHVVQAVGRATLSVQVFAGLPAGSPLAPSGPRSVADAIRLGSWRPSVRTALNAGGVGILGFSAVQSLDGAAGGLFEARATMTVELSLVTEIVETGTFIERVQVESEPPLPPMAFEVEI